MLDAVALRFIAPLCGIGLLWYASSLSGGAAPATHLARVASFVSGTYRWEDAMARAKQAMDRGAYTEAERSCDDALSLAETIPGLDLRVAKTLLFSAQVYRAQEKWDVAEKRFKEALSSGESAVGAFSSELLPPLENLAGFYFLVRQRYDLALPLCERMLKLLQAEPIPDVREIARQTRNLAGVYEKLERFDEAETFYHQSLGLAEKNGDDISGSLLVVADFYCLWGKPDCAEAMATRAVELCEKSLGTVGEKKIEFAVALYKLAEIYRLWEKPAKAVPIYNRCLAVMEKTEDLTSSAIVPPLTGRAAALRDQGKLEDAETDYRRALAVAHQTMDPALPEVTMLVDVYAGLLVQLHRNKDADTVHAEHQWRTFIHGASRELKANRFPEAERLCTAAIELSGTFNSNVTNASDAYLLMGEIHRMEGKFDLAEQSYTQALAACEKAVGPDAQAVITPLEALANFYYFTRARYHWVVRLDQRILGIAEKVFAAEPGEVARRARNLADVYRLTHCREKAETFYRQAVALSEKAKGDPGEQVQYLQALGDYYRESARHTEAEEAHMRALGLREKAAETNPSPDAQLDVAVCLDALAEDFLSENQAQKAEPLCRRSASIVASLGGTDNPDLVPRLTRLGVALRSLRKFGEAESSLIQARSIVDKNPDAPEQSALNESYAALLVDLKRPEEAKAFLASTGKSVNSLSHDDRSIPRPGSDIHLDRSCARDHGRRGHRTHRGPTRVD